MWSHEPGQETDAELVAKLDELAAFLEREGATVSRTARPAFAAVDAYHLYLQIARCRLERAARPRKRLPTSAKAPRGARPTT